MKEEQNILYRKFQTTGQERVRLACALEGFFSEEKDKEAEKKVYGQYLKRRIRPAMEALIQEENVLKMEQLEAKGWFGAEELDQFIAAARKKRRLESLVWLMKLKDSKYGYKDKTFEL